VTRFLLRSLAWRSAAAALALALAACASTTRPVPQATDEALVQAIARQPVVLLGEVHDNVAQHALRAQALRRTLAGGARPALAFEQLDHEHQAALEQARAQTLADGVSLPARIARLIDVAGGRGWNWDLYRPYLALALEYELPIVAANLSRPQAMRVAQHGIAAVFAPSERARLGLDQIPEDIERLQQTEIADGHCGQLPAEALAPMAAAQIARDAQLAQAILPYADRGVILLTGNGHARRDIGVARYLPPEVQARTVSIGLLEDDGKAAARAAHFDFSLRTPVQQRADPCASVGHGALGRMTGAPAGSQEAAPAGPGMGGGPSLVPAPR